MTTTRPLPTGASAAAMVTGFGRFGSRICFAPDGDGRSNEQVAAAMAKKREEEKGDSAKKDGAKPDAAKKDAARKDGDGDDKKPEDKMDRLLSMMDSIGTRLDATNARMDAMDREKNDAAEKAKADAAKADAGKSGKADDMSQPGKDEREVSERQSDVEDKQEGERDKAGVGDSAKKDAAKKDTARKDEDADEIERKKREAKDDAAKADKAKADAALDLSRYDREISDIKARMPRVLTDAEEANFAAAQAKADGAYNLHGKRAPAPMQGETLMAYRLRTSNELKKFSPTFKASNLYGIAAADPATYDAIEATIYADSAIASNNPMDIERGELRMRTTRDMTGRQMHDFIGPDTFIKSMQAPVMKYVKTFNTGHPGHA